MRTLAPAAAMLALSACAAGRVTLPVESTFLAHGLEQQIRIEPRGEDGEVFSLTSRLVNRRSEAVTVRVVTCYLHPKENLRASAELVIRAIPGCVPEPNVLTLAPGQASNTVWFVGQLDRPGRHTIRVRHALDPEFWGVIRVRAR
ncbi:MAG TPA: hypothetical protein VHG08_14045 [Longimicrobium sp.]|nr:hypothetical protein [Longimicrobium sp.]